MLDNFISDVIFWLTQPISQGVSLLGDRTVIGVILILLGIVIWTLTIVILKFAVFDMLFPKIRVIDSYINTIVYCRRIINTKGSYNNNKYMMVKFKLRPFFRWHKLKLPKSGHNGVKWRRLPMYIDILTDNIYLNWNDDEKCYELGRNEQFKVDDDWDYYINKTNKNIRTIGTIVADAVRGDYDLMKKQFQLELPVTVKPPKNNKGGNNNDTGESQSS